MDLKTLLDTPPWDWPRDAGWTLRKVLVDHGANESDRLVAAELAGDFTVINDELADALLIERIPIPVRRMLAISS